MGDEHDQRGRRPTASPMAPDAEGKTAAPNTQSQGGIGHEVARAAREDFDPSTGLPGGPLGRADPPRMSLDQGGGKAPSDGRAHHGFSGDDGAHLATGSTGTPASRQSGTAADLGAQQDQRLHASPSDPAERTTGGDSPNRGGIAGSPGGPARMAPSRMPGEDADEGVVQGGQSGNDAQQDQQI